MKTLTQERLKELLHYDPMSGVFMWKMSRPGIKLSRVAGTVSKKDGYIRINVDYQIYLASRLAWFYQEGYWPEHEVDHRDRIRDNNKWENLRHASRQCNSRNCNISKWNTSGITGVSWDKGKQRWESYVTISGKRFHLGYFTDKINAAYARLSAEVKYKFPNCNTTSSAYLYIQTATDGNKCAIN